MVLKRTDVSCRYRKLTVSLNLGQTAQVWREHGLPVAGIIGTTSMSIVQCPTSCLTFISNSCY